MENSPCNDTICRTCMSKAQSLHSILEYESVNKLRIIEILMTTVPQLHIQPGIDKLPELICGVCLNKLNIAYHYQQLCIQTDGRLKAMLVHDAEDDEDNQHQQMDIETKLMDVSLLNKAAAESLVHNADKLCIKVKNEAECDELLYSHEEEEATTDIATVETGKDENDSTNKTFVLIDWNSPGRPESSVVPVLWLAENGSKCFYPKKTGKPLKSMLRDGLTRPEPNWPCYLCTVVNYYDNFDDADAEISKNDLFSDEDDTGLGVRTTRNKRCRTDLESNIVKYAQYVAPKPCDAATCNVKRKRTSTNIENISVEKSRSQPPSPPQQNLQKSNILPIEVTKKSEWQNWQQTTSAKINPLIPSPSLTQHQTRDIVSASQPQINTMPKCHPQYSIASAPHQQNKTAKQELPNMQQYQPFKTQQLNMQQQQQPQQFNTQQQFNAHQLLQFSTEQQQNSQLSPQLYQCSTNETDHSIEVLPDVSTVDLVHMEGLNAIKCDIALLINKRLNIFEATFNSKLDEFIKFITSKFDGTNDNASISGISRRNETAAPTTTNPFILISNKAQFDNFIEHLSDEKYFNCLISECQKMWRSTKWQERDYAYDLTDKIFSRPFLAQCSWTGGSTKGQEKINIKNKTILLQFYLKALSTVHEISAKDVEAFLRSLLKNSRARSQAKGVRTSRQRKSGIKRKVPCSNIKQLEEQIVEEKENIVREKESDDDDNEEGNDIDEDGQRSCDEVADRSDEQEQDDNDLTGNSFNSLTK